MAKKKHKYFFVSQEVREGDRDYTLKWCECRSPNTTVEDLEDEYSVEHDLGVDVENPEIYTEDPYVQEMTEAEYKVVRRFV